MNIVTLMILVCLEFIQQNGEYYLKEYGKSMILWQPKRNWYNISNWWSSKRVVSAKLNDSLFVSALHNIAIYETVDLELVYDIKYNIKQIRCQTLWVDYLQKEVNG